MAEVRDLVREVSVVAAKAISLDRDFRVNIVKAAANVPVSSRKAVHVVRA